MMKNWGTDYADLAAAALEFEAALPGFWWSIGQCSVGAHASCAVDGSGSQAHLLDGIPQGHPYDNGFHCDTQLGQPAFALRDVMNQAIAFMAADGQVAKRTDATTPTPLLFAMQVPEWAQDMAAQILQAEAKETLRRRNLDRRFRDMPEERAGFLRPDNAKVSGLGPRIPLLRVIAAKGQMASRDISKMFPEWHGAVSEHTTPLDRAGLIKTTKGHGNKCLHTITPAGIAHLRALDGPASASDDVSATGQPETAIAPVAPANRPVVKRTVSWDAGFSSAEPRTVTITLADGGKWRGAAE